MKDENRNHYHFMHTGSPKNKDNWKKTWGLINNRYFIKNSRFFNKNMDVKNLCDTN